MLFIFVSNCHIVLCESVGISFRIISMCSVCFQKTVRSFSGNSEKVMAVCRKCHKTCLPNNNNLNNNNDSRRPTDINANCQKSEGFSDDWGGSSVSALSPTDPFLPVPHISVQPATPLNNNFSWSAAEANNSSFVSNSPAISLIRLELAIVTSLVLTVLTALTHTLSLAHVGFLSHNAP